LSDAGGLRGNADAAAIESGKRDFVAFAFVADAVGSGNFAIGEDQFAAGRSVDAKLFFFLADFEAGRAFFHDESSDSSFAFGRIGVHVHDSRVSSAAIGGHAFVPLTTYASPFFAALVCNAAALEPACGSVSA